MADDKFDLKDYEGKRFEELLDELETLTELMSSGRVGIEEATDLYERAGALQALAQAKLDDIQKRIDALAAPSDSQEAVE